MFNSTLFILINSILKWHFSVINKVTCFYFKSDIPEILNCCECLITLNPFISILSFSNFSPSNSFPYLIFFYLFCQSFYFFPRKVKRKCTDKIKLFPYFFIYFVCGQLDRSLLASFGRLLFTGFTDMVNGKMAGKGCLV